MTILVIALSYGKRQEELEPNPVNFRLAREVEDIIDTATEALAVVVQWEIARQLKKDGYGKYIDLVVTSDSATYKGKKRYLDSQDVITEALDWFKRTFNESLAGVIVVANPFLHLSASKKLVRAMGFDTIDYPISKVGFDNSPHQLQWWCKSPIQFVLYGVIVTAGKMLGLNLHGIGERAK